MTALLAVFCAILGLLIGSFLNVVAYRVPRNESIVRPASRCPACEHPIRPRDNIPVISWLLLRGRCRDCGVPVSKRYPIVEALTGLLFGGLALRIGFEPELPAFLYLGAVGMALALIDLDVKRLPNVLTLPSYAVGAVLLGVAALVEGETTDLVRAVLGMVALFVFYFVLAFAYPAGMGFGDVKLSGVLGLYLGWISWGALVVGAFAGFLLGGVLGGVLMAIGRAGRKSAIPFGPFMLAGALLGLLVGDAVAGAYVDSLG